MSVKFHNTLTVSGSHGELEEFLVHNIKIRFSGNGKYVGKVPLFSLGALLPMPACADCDWAYDNWGCDQDTCSEVTLPDMGWVSHSTSLKITFLTLYDAPTQWFRALAARFPRLFMQMTCVCTYEGYVIVFQARDGKVTHEEYEGEEFVARYMGPEDIRPAVYRVPKNPDAIPTPQRRHRGL